MSSCFMAFTLFNVLFEGGNFLQSRRELLLEYVRTVQPEFMEKFVQRAPPQVLKYNIYIYV